MSVTLLNKGAAECLRRKQAPPHPPLPPHCTAGAMRAHNTTDPFHFWLLRSAGSRTALPGAARTHPGVQAPAPSKPAAQPLCAPLSREALQQTHRSERDSLSWPRRSRCRVFDATTSVAPLELDGDAPPRQRDTLPVASTTAELLSLLEREINTALLSRERHSAPRGRWHLARQQGRKAAAARHTQRLVDDTAAIRGHLDLSTASQEARLRDSGWRAHVAGHH